MIGSIIGGVASTAASFSQMIIEGNNKRKAEAAAQKAFKKAQKILSVNYAEQLGLNKDIYDAARDSSNVTAAAELEAAKEGSTRGVAATAGQVYQTDLKNQRDILIQQGQRQQEIDNEIARTDASIAQDLANLQKDRAAGAQLAAANAGTFQREATKDFFTGIGGIAESSADLVSLYSGRGEGKGIRQDALAGLVEGDVEGLEAGVLTESLGGISDVNKFKANRQFNKLDQSVQDAISNSPKYNTQVDLLKQQKREGFLGEASFSNSTLTAEERALIKKNPQLLDILLKIK
tara:strand:+ start:126 stop:998 length:873 start_codon:yes stop_codon:yes gene_type:complete